VLLEARPAARALAFGGLGVVLAVVTLAAAAPLIAPPDPVRQSLRTRLAAPTLAGADGKAHPLGTDHLGRDVLSRVIHGARVSRSSCSPSGSSRCWARAFPR
jgi:peptide/nickel transport system permease protein